MRYIYKSKNLPFLTLEFNKYSEYGYVFVTIDGKQKQIGYKGCFEGNMMLVTDDNFEKAVKKWAKYYIKNIKTNFEQFEYLLAKVYDVTDKNKISTDYKCFGYNFIDKYSNNLTNWNKTNVEFYRLVANHVKEVANHVKVTDLIVCIYGSNCDVNGVMCYSLVYTSN